jgi:hypothetical protein
MFIGPGQPTVPFDVIGVALAPAAAGVYALCAAEGAYVFFGETEDIRARLTEHLIAPNDRITQGTVVFFAYELHASRGIRLARRNQLIMTFGAGC